MTNSEEVDSRFLAVLPANSFQSQTESALMIQYDHGVGPIPIDAIKAFALVWMQKCSNSSSFPKWNNQMKSAERLQWLHRLHRITTVLHLNELVQQPFDTELRSECDPA